MRKRFPNASGVPGLGELSKPVRARARARTSPPGNDWRTSMARPRDGNEKRRPRHLGFRTEIWVHDAVHRLAAEHGQHASDIAHELLEIALGSLGIKRPAPGVPPHAAAKDGR